MVSARAHTHTGDLPCKASGMTSKLKDAKFFHWTFPFINCLKNYRTLHISGCIAKKIQKKTLYWISRNNNGKAGQKGERWPFDNQVISCGKVGRVVLKVQLVLESMETLLNKSQLLHHKTRFSRMFGRQTEFAHVSLQQVPTGRTRDPVFLFEKMSGYADAEQTVCEFFIV